MPGDPSPAARAEPEPDFGSASRPREVILARWIVLTREILPRMAAAHAWPIRHDHCFMRVCLDTALGARWDTVVRRPAIRHLDREQLARAVEQAERIVADPTLLASLDRASLQSRGRSGGFR